MTRVASPCRLPGVSTACLLVGTSSIIPEPGRAQLSRTRSDLLAAWVSAMRCLLVSQSWDSGVPAPPFTGGSGRAALGRGLCASPVTLKRYSVSRAGSGHFPRHPAGWPSERRGPQVWKLVVPCHHQESVLGIVANVTGTSWHSGWRWLQRVQWETGLRVSFVPWTLRGGTKAVVGDTGICVLRPVPRGCGEEAGSLSLDVSVCFLRMAPQRLVVKGPSCARPWMGGGLARAGHAHLRDRGLREVEPLT